MMLNYKASSQNFILVLGGHENRSGGTPVADLKAEDIAIEGQRAIDIADIYTYVSQRSDFRHAPSSNGWIVKWTKYDCQ
jgi:hypothetical protein